MDISRRSFLAVTTLAPCVFLAGGSAAAQTAACYDPAKLALSQKSMRRSLGYVEASSDPNKRCSLCAFFTGTQAGCGNCALLSGNPVNADGLCTSFAAKG